MTAGRGSRLANTPSQQYVRAVGQRFFNRPSHRPSFRAVLFLVVALLVLVHVLEATRAPLARQRFNLIAMLVPLAAVAAASESRRRLAVALGLGLLSAGAGANALFGRGTGLPGLDLLGAVAFLAFTTYVLLDGVVRSERVSLDVIGRGARPGISCSA